LWYIRIISGPHEAGNVWITLMTKMNLGRVALLLLLGFPLHLVLAEDLPKPFAFARYQTMMDRSPFAVATAVVPAGTPSFAKDLYVANVARTEDGGLVTIASSTDKMFKRYLTTTAAVDGYSITNIEWSDKVGATKVTIAKDGQSATLSFNEALLRQPAGPGQNPVAQQAQKQDQNPPPAPVISAAQPPVPGAQPIISGAQPIIPGAQPNAIKPMPVPTLPTPPPRVRGVIPRNPAPQPNAVQTPAPQPEL
jgi:hypothetical protein